MKSPAAPEYLRCGSFDLKARVSAHWSRSEMSAVYSGEAAHLRACSALIECDHHERSLWGVVLEGIRLRAPHNELATILRDGGGGMLSVGLKDLCILDLE